MEQILVDANRATDELYKFYNEFTGELRKVASEAIDVVTSLPTIAPVHATGACYCRECVHYIEADNGICGRECLFEQPHVYPTDFCSYGKQKENNFPTQTDREAGKDGV